MGERNKINLLQVIHSLHIGGAEKVVVDLATRLDGDRYSVTVCCLNEKGILAQDLEMAGIDVVIPEKSRRHRFLNSFSLRELIRKHEPDIVHTHGTPALLHAFPSYMIGNMPPMVHTFHYGNYPHLPRKYLYAERVGVRFARQLVAVSYHQRDAVIRHLYVRPDRIMTILNGVSRVTVPGVDRRENLRREMGAGRDKILIGCVAVLSVQKGVTYLLEAARRITAKNSNVHFVIIGGGPLQQELEAESRGKGLSDCVTFLGWRNDARELMGALDIYVAPSLWEGLSISLLEAMSAGLPVVTTSVGDNDKVIRNADTGLLVPPGDVPSLTDALLYLVDNPDKARQMGESSAEYFAAKLSVDRMVQEYDRVYSAVWRASRPAAA